MHILAASLLLFCGSDGGLELFFNQNHSKNYGFSDIGETYYDF